MSDKPYNLEVGARKEIPGILSSYDAGGTISFIIVNGQFVAVPVSQEWFWSPKWQTQHEQALQDMETGRYIEFDDGDDFVSSLAELIDE